MSSRRWISRLFVLACFLATTAQAAGGDAGKVPGWPRDYDSGTQRIEVYQPQIESWEGNRIGGRAAVALGDTAQKNPPIYGVAYFAAQADTDKAVCTCVAKSTV